MPGVLSLLVVVLCACSSSGSSTATTTQTGTGVFTAVAKVTDPPATGHIVEPVTAANLNLSASGYEEQEFFVSGTAHAFHGDFHPGRRPVDDHSDDECSL